VGILQKVSRALGRRPLTAEEVAARAEAKLIRDQINEDKLSQLTGAGQNYRSRGR